MTELETMQRAKRYMDQLAQGIDPISGQEVPGDSVLNQVRLARCFFYVSGILEQVIANGGVVEKKAARNTFVISEEQLRRVEVSAEPLRITEFITLLHQAAGAPDMGKPKTTLITDWLLEQGFLYKDTGLDGKSRRLPTEAGSRLGLITQRRQGQYGEYIAVYYNADAQRFILDHWPSIADQQ